MHGDHDLCGVFFLCSVEGRVSTLVALSDRHMACTAELPLESLCHAASTDMFKVPGRYLRETCRKDVSKL